MNPVSFLCGVVGSSLSPGIITSIIPVVSIITSISLFSGVTPESIIPYFSSIMSLSLASSL